MELIKITPDKEKARNILKMISLIEERIKKQEKEKMAALIIADYYEIIKELITAILLIDGYKTLSHKDLVDYIKEKYTEFTKQEISVLDDLRVLRNRIAYEGFFVEPSYLYRNEYLFRTMIQKLRNLIEKKLK
jgi:RecJ-like exonuclease